MSNAESKEKLDSKFISANRTILPTHIDIAGFDGLNEGVGVLLSDCLDQLPMRSFIVRRPARTSQRGRARLDRAADETRVVSKIFRSRQSDIFTK